MNANFLDLSELNIEDVVEENRRLRQKLRAKEKTIRQLQLAHQDDREVSSDDMPFRFLALSVELRTMIYQLCLVPGKVFWRPRPEHDRRYEGHEHYFLPEWQLLLVSRKVREEAAKVLFSENHCVFSWAGLEWDEAGLKRSVVSKDNGVRSLKELMQQHIRSSSIAFDVRALAKDPIRHGAQGRERSHTGFRLGSGVF